MHDLQIVMLEHARQGKDVAQIVIDHQHLAAREHRIGLAHVGEDGLLRGRQYALAAVQKNRRFVEKPLDGGSVAHRTHAGAAVDFRDLLFRERAAPGDDDRRNLQRPASIGLFR